MSTIIGQKPLTGTVAMTPKAPKRSATSNSPSQSPTPAHTQINLHTQVYTNIMTSCGNTMRQTVQTAKQQNYTRSLQQLTLGVWSNEGYQAGRR